MIDINILDGHSVIGGNKILVEGEDGAIMLDFGINFSSWGKYFEEFLSPRSGLMVKDLLKLGLLPRL
ncbi:MAG TPA: ribonuclease J, partial [bacterium]|nr:ribonuclease J [bacterium]